MNKITDEQITLICLRCGKEFNNSVPKITNSKGFTEIATNEWCSDCNNLCMNLVFREGTAYKVKLLGNTLIKVDLTSPIYTARSPKGKQLEDIQKFIRETEEDKKKYPLMFP